MQFASLENDRGGQKPPSHDFVPPQAFPAWYFAEFVIGNEWRVVSIFHIQTSFGMVPYWYDDPEFQHRALPLLKSYNPRSLGDYGSFLSKDQNLLIFVSLCKLIDDLPEPLLSVQVIRWVNRKMQDKRIEQSSLQDIVSEALIYVRHNIKRRRNEYESVMKMVMISQR